MRDPGVQIGSQHTKEVSHSPLQPPSSGMLHDNTLLEASNALSAATPNNELDSDNAGDVGTDDEACDDFDKVQTVLESVSM
ncbi:hypothetical protein FRC08_001154 [Ceratobasidium sp. 394]|nr:hypothetical protein FRC08_001154 [Ceratobasidium sp. 394]